MEKRAAGLRVKFMLAAFSTTLLAVLLVAGGLGIRTSGRLPWNIDLFIYAGILALGVSCLAAAAAVLYASIIVRRIREIGGLARTLNQTTDCLQKGGCGIKLAEDLG